MENKALQIVIHGIVQGVGFRPFVYNLAVSLFLHGTVSNIGGDVFIIVEGEQEALDAFVQRLTEEKPPLSVITGITVQEVSLSGIQGFHIQESRKGEGASIYISPDVAICAHCKKELFDPNDRRFLYPLINCTHCGPRFTITRSIPYDRENTTMDRFPMCGDCQKEYTDPTNRRYHAQPVSCYQCGPEMSLRNADGELQETTEAVKKAARLLQEGMIVAIKGLGGYHLACNAQDRDAVQRLRQRKHRDDKPFAVMVRDMETAECCCSLNDTEKRILESVESPIVLVHKKSDTRLVPEIAPGNPYLGVMLPYTPLHLLLFYHAEGVDALVMTSGNLSDEPIFYKDEEAVQGLKGIADAFLLHNREIHIRTDDTVTRSFRDSEYLVRRSRGYVPKPVQLGFINELFAGKKEIPSVLALGGELKSTFCLNKGDELYLSHHIGDLKNVETFASFTGGVRHMQDIFRIQPSIVAYDLHPDYLSTNYALEVESLQKIAVQHHHAHIASCMADNSLIGDVIGVAFDGVGYGEDGKAWGGEFFTGDYHGFSRVAHLAYVGMPGGDAAAREPWRMALSWLYTAYGDALHLEGLENGVAAQGRILLESIETSKIRLMMQLLDRGIQSPLTSSAGRLFDAISALLGVRTVVTYEGQAAIELENIAWGSSPTMTYPFSLKKEANVWIIGCAGILKGVVNDLNLGVHVSAIAGRFHHTLATLIVKTCSAIRKDSGLTRVALSGGVFQNLTLLGDAVTLLEAAGFEVFVHHRVPANDGGISLGQAAMALARVRQK